MLDANIVIALLAGEPAALRARVERCRRGTIVISSIAFAEVSLGSVCGKRPASEVLEQVTRLFDVLAFDARAAWAYARLPFRRGSFDRLIAAHALSLDAILVTNNERDFAGIPGLAVENWTR
ncbi:type II toxin-antitoxin system VapC family toxin [Sphingomonas sp. BK580]|uniref:type II toxin-antitoxin system VapC family toxin n=1 Tax=Sphingomonas sp. BK580 TaxID=2586972 RepID=UPI001C85DB0C|nr:type II toxin-antitoxin system VapC family toxin [Sphingomonas sp. BK580]